jgi:hypothetical protein
VGVAPATTPLPNPIDPGPLQQLRAQGWQHSSKVAAHTGQRISNAEGYRLIRPSSAGVQLSLIPIRTRADDDLGADTIARLLSGDRLGKAAPLTINGHAFLRSGGTHQGGTNQQVVASTCVAGGKGRSTAVGVFLELTRVPKSLAERINSLVGGQPLNAWSCLFTRIAVPRGPDADQQIERVWSTVAPVVTGRSSVTDRSSGS